MPVELRPGLPFEQKSYVCTPTTANLGTLFLASGEVTSKAGVRSTVRTYTMGGEAVATRDSTSVKLMVADNNGTPLMSVDGVTQAFEKRRYSPYGEVLQAPVSWPSSRGYLNKVTDKTGTTHLDAREYDAAGSRFISVDPVMDPMDPQQMNGYAYANNSPVTMVDPDGQRATCGDYGGGGCYVGNGKKGSAKAVKYKGATKSSRLAGKIGYDSYKNPKHTKENKKAINAVRSIAKFIDKEPGPIDRMANSVASWATEKRRLPSPEFISGAANMAYGTYKVGSGLALFSFGTAADVTGVGAILGVPAQTFGVYQVGTGVMRTKRGLEQFGRAYDDPVVSKSYLQYGADIGLGVSPGGDSITDFLGGLP